MGDDFKPNLRRIAQALNHGQELRRGCARKLVRGSVAAPHRLPRMAERLRYVCGHPQICREPGERVLNSLVVEVGGQGAGCPRRWMLVGFLGAAELISILTFWLR